MKSRYIYLREISRSRKALSWQSHSRDTSLWLQLLQLLQLLHLKETACSSSSSYVIDQLNHVTRELSTQETRFGHCALKCFRTVLVPVLGDTLVSDRSSEYCHPSSVGNNPWWQRRPRITTYESTQDSYSILDDTQQESKLRLQYFNKRPWY